MKTVKHILVLFICLLLTNKLWAYDFNAVYNGDTIYYNITSSSTPYTVEVTYKSIIYPAYSDAVSIPSTVLYNGIHYSVTGIGDYAFEFCDQLTSVTLPMSIVSIGSSAFGDCSKLTSITIPDSVNQIFNAFDNCIRLKTVYYNAIECNTNYTSPFLNCDSITSIIFGPKVRVIPMSLCYILQNITSIIIPNSVREIDENAFFGCEGLTSITIPDSIEILDGLAFESCSNLTTVYFNAINANSTFDESPFSGCGKISSFIFGNKVKSIQNNLCEGLGSITSITIPNSVKEIGYYAFSGCSGLTSLTLSNTLKVIRFLAFENCSNLNGAFIIPNSVDTIENEAFYNCGFTSITINESLENLGEYVFESNGNLTTVYYNAINCQTTNNSCPFSYCDNLTTFNFGPKVQIVPDAICLGLSNLITVSFTNSIISIGEVAFNECTGLTTITFPDSLLTIGREAFKGCTSLSGSLIIPNLVSTIDINAFEDCNALSEITFGKNVTHINDYAFSNCIGISKITVFAVTPPEIEEYTFSSITSEVPVLVPCMSREDYLSADFWKDLNIQNINQYQLQILSNDTLMGTVELLKGLCESDTVLFKANPKDGFKFVKWNDNNTDNPRTVVVTQDTSFTAIFELIDAVQETNIEKMISVYPNPVKDILTIYNTKSIIKEVRIVDVVGREVKRIIINNNESSFDIKELKSGIYILTIHTDNGNITKRIVKE